MKTLRQDDRQGAALGTKCQSSFRHLKCIDDKTRNDLYTDSFLTSGGQTNTAKFLPFKCYSVILIIYVLTMPRDGRHFS